MSRKSIELIYNTTTGKMERYDPTYDITIHCKTSEEKERVEKILASVRWIPVSEKLPEEYGEYLATYKTVDGRKFMDILEYEPSYEFDYENHRFKGEWLFANDDSRFTDGEVIAWKFLPDLYEAKE